MNHLNLFFFVSVMLLLVCCSRRTEDANRIYRLHGEIATNGMVVTAHPLASKIGLEILKKGGNAFDAAIAVKFALAVVYPRAGNIAGGGFMVCRTKDGKCYSLDFREKAPSGSHRDMFLDEKGEIVENLSLLGGMAVAVPGTVDGMIQIHEKFGSLPWKELIQPAVDLAAKSIILTKNESDILNHYREMLLEANVDTPVFVRKEYWKEGDSICYLDLSQTLERIRDYGRDGFYSGETARLFIAQIRIGGGIINENDLDNYHSVWREPLIGDYRGYRIISMPLPSSGGVALLQLLKSSEKYDLRQLGHNTTKTVHLMTEFERRVYADRATHLGDPDFYAEPVSELLSETYIEKRMSDINMESKTPSEQIKAGKVEIIESHETTHFSITDNKGNAVAITTTLNSNFGSKVYVKGGGFLLNNEMDDFSSKPGIANQFGLLGNDVNAIEPNKRMLSSMTPTLVEKDGKLFMVVGTPGGSTIITSVYQTIVNVIDHNMSMQEAVNAKKVHHQWQPDEVYAEEGALSQQTVEELTKMGHVIIEWVKIGKIEGILITDDGKMEGAADYTRGDDKALGY